MITVTTQMLWQGTAFFALIDAAFLPLLVRLVKPDRFRRLERLLALIAEIFWCLLWTLNPNKPSPA